MDGKNRWIDGYIDGLIGILMDFFSYHHLKIIVLVLLVVVVVAAVVVVVVVNGLQKPVVKSLFLVGGGLCGKRHKLSVYMLYISVSTFANHRYHWHFWLPIVRHAPKLHHIRCRQLEI